jgi:hypothetical protein
LVSAIVGLYRPATGHGLPGHWLRDFRDLLAQEPSLHGEYLKATGVAERPLADAVAERMRAEGDPLRPRVLAGMVVGAERAAVMYWMATRHGSLVDAVRAALQQATAGLDDPT